MAAKKTRTSTKRTAPTNSSPKRSFALSSFKLKDLILPAIIVLVILLLGIFKNQFVVAMVNGKQISRLQLISALEKKDGKAVLENIITEELIFQEAKKKGVTVPADEINQEISTIEASVSGQGESLDALLAQQNMTRGDLEKQVRIQLILKKLVGGNVAVTDKEVDDYIETNKESIPESTDSAALLGQVKQQLQQQKLNEKIQSYVADLQKNAKVEYLLK